jgi:5-methylcytosine-specific restriction endonuclease McrA
VYCVVPKQIGVETLGLCITCERAQQKSRAVERRRKNPTKHREYAKQYAARFPEKVKALKRLARARNRPAHRAMEGTRRRLKRVQRCSCCTRKEFGAFYAARPAGYHVDHVVPLSRGGSHCVRNMQYLPAAVNIRKHNRLPTELRT